MGNKWCVCSVSALLPSSHTDRCCWDPGLWLDGGPFFSGCLLLYVYSIQTLTRQNRFPWSASEELYFMFSDFCSVCFILDLKFGLNRKLGFYFWQTKFLKKTRSWNAAVSKLWSHLTLIWLVDQKKTQKTGVWRFWTFDLLPSWNQVV